MSDEVDNATGIAPARENVIEQLTEKREAMEAARQRYRIAREMRDEDGMAAEGQRIDALKDIILELETEVVGAREQDGAKQAKARMIGIRRAYGSVASELDEDEKRVGEKIAELSDAIARLNDRYSQVAQLRAEALALSDRFDLAKPTLPSVVPPARRDIVTTLTRLPNRLLDHAERYQPTEQCEHNLRTRRSYAEAAGTPGAEIIASAGVKPFPDLTERQRQIVAARVREKEDERRQIASLPIIPTEGSVPLGCL